MGLKSWLKMKKEILPSRRRSSAPPMPVMPVMEPVDYDPNANREEYLQAFKEFKQRGSKYNQLTIKEENEENVSESTGQNTNKATDENGAECINHQQNTKSKPCKPKRHSLPSKMSRSLLNRSPQQKTNTPNTSVVSENNNSIFVNEILSFEHNCINDSSFGAAGVTPPQKFYRDNSHPFPDDMKKPDNVKTKSPTKKTRACGILSLIRPDSKKEPASSSSGAYERYDFNSSLSNDVDRSPKKSIGQDIPAGLYEEIVNIFENRAQHNVPVDQVKQKNSPAKSPVKSPVKSNNESGISGISPFTSFRQCQGIVDENFEFLNDRQWNSCLEEENEFVTEDNRINVEVTDLDNSVHAGPSNCCVAVNPDPVEENANKVSELDEECNRNVEPSVFPEAPREVPKHIIECKAKDIHLKLSYLNNTIETPFTYACGSFRKHTVFLKKCNARDSATARLVEEASERDYEILSKVKHPHIVILMAVCFHKNLLNHMTLVMEQVDCTLNHLLHKMDYHFTVLETIAVVQQISTAALYLHECGHIHSNISSHNILVRERPFSVKLTSCELATDIDCEDIRAEVESNYLQWNGTSKVFFDYSKKAQQPTDPEDIEASFLMEHYMDMLNQSPASSRGPHPQYEFMSTPSKYLRYDTSYRQCLSLYNYVAPELLGPDRFVFPTTKTDVYSLSLLLWEILNKTVPYLMYSKDDLEEMISNNKMNYQFHERKRCYYFKDVFDRGLAVNEEDRYSMDDFIETLEAVELVIVTVHGEDTNISSNFHSVNSRTANTPKQIFEETVDETFVSSVMNESENLNVTMKDLVIPSSLLDFNISLIKKERTSTRKFRKKAESKSLQHLTGLFTTDNDSPNEGTSDEVPKEPALVDLNDNCSLDSYQILDITSDDNDELKNNMAKLGHDLNNLLNDTKEIISQPKTANEPLIEESEVISKTPIEPSQIVKPVNTTNVVPSVVGFSMKSKLNNSKTSANLLDGPASGVTRKLFTSKNEPSTSGYYFENEVFPLPDTPIARENDIRRKNWLSQQSSSNNEYVGKRNETDNEAVSLNDGKKFNVSVRIVHNKVTPKKVDDGRPSILSKINFFNSATETAKPGNSLYDNCLITTVKRNDTPTNNIPRKEAVSMFNEPVNELGAEKYESGVRSKIIPNEKTSIMNELKESMNKKSLDQPQQTHLFENKYWKKELDICNKSFTSNDGETNSKVVTPKFRSVRDTVMKFEKRAEDTKTPLSTQKTPTELVKSLPTNQQHPRDSNNTRSIEDLYIDDDFVHGFDAMSPNIELQSYYSDLVDFDMFPTDIPDSKHDGVETNISN